MSNHTMRRIRVRIAVAVDVSGNWNSCGSAHMPEDEAMAFARDPLGGPDAQYWIEGWVDPRGQNVGRRCVAERHDNPKATAMSNPKIRRMVRPPSGLKQLDALAWCIGRDDRAQGRLPVRASLYRPDKSKHYMAGYESQTANATGSATEVHP